MFAFAERRKATYPLMTEDTWRVVWPGQFYWAVMLRVSIDHGNGWTGITARQLTAYEFEAAAINRANSLSFELPRDQQDDDEIVELEWGALEHGGHLRYAEKCGQDMYDKVLDEGGTKEAALLAYYAAFHQAHNARQLGTW